MIEPIHTAQRRGTLLERLSLLAARWSGSAWAFATAVSIVVVWVLTGPIFKYSDTWQLVINTGTTIVTFLMVFLLQRSQNKDSLAIQLKLNEIVAAMRGASNQLINVEDMCEEDINRLRDHYAQLADRIREEKNPSRAHSIEEAQADLLTEMKTVQSG
ncbi:MAG: low affinity iron permease family protein [Gemmataceae bacterium]|nr:low affinity iron permease family protein [Gemmataceae bacterium]